MAALESAHRGYEYQDLLIACRLVDVMLGTIKRAYVDRKLVPQDRFDDLTTVDVAGRWERVQLKHTDDNDRPLTLRTFTSDTRRLRLDRLVSSAAADRDQPNQGTTEFSFRIVLRDTVPTDTRLLEILTPTTPDPGPFVRGLDTVRLSLQASALWTAAAPLASDPPPHNLHFGFLRTGSSAVRRQDLDWLCQHLVVELNAPVASLDLTRPGPAEQLLLQRVRNEVGTGVYPNTNRAAVDVAAALVGCARAARLGSITPTAPELLRRTQLRSDFGAVVRRHPVVATMEVQRPPTVAELVQRATAAANDGRAILLVGPPGQGKSWICKQVLNGLSDQNWLVAEHYCYLGEADKEKRPRVHAESVLGSLLARIAERDPALVSAHRPRFAADEQAIEHAVIASLQKEPTRRVALVVDGIDHATRVIHDSAVTDEPSLALARVLASLRLPRGCALLVLSQPGTHLKPLEEIGAATVHIPGLTDLELRTLAIHLGVIGKPMDDPDSTSIPPLQSDEAAAEEFVEGLSARSSGNALYATYLCREALRSSTTAANPSLALRSMPHFDGSLRAYYDHLQTSLGPRAAWVADVIALVDFPISRTELKQISPESAHRVDDAVEVLRPVLSENAAQAGIRIYHESFARYLREPYRDSPATRTALLGKIITWLEHRGLFEDSRAFRYLLRTLADAGNHEAVVDKVGRDFVVESISHGFPASSIMGNLSIAIESAARIGNWPAIGRYVEMSRSAETYEYERFESTLVNYADVIGSVLGAATLVESLLHDGHTTVPARSGLQVCETLDVMGEVPPWSEYLLAFAKESEEDNTLYGLDSDRAVLTSLMRGRLRLASLEETQTSVSGRRSSPLNTEGDTDGGFLVPVDWSRFATWVSERNLHPADVVDAVLDTFGLAPVVELIDMVACPSLYCLALAESFHSGKIGEGRHETLHWALRSLAEGTPTGCVSRLMDLGVDIAAIDSSTLEESRERLQRLTREIQGRLTNQEAHGVAEWIDACVVAARRDLIGLGVAEAIIEGPGWYPCWLRFVIALVLAEARPDNDRSEAVLDALRILTEVQDPFLGEPRACDLYAIHGQIRDTIQRAVRLLDDHAWKKGIELLNSVSNATTTSFRGEMTGPLPRDELLHIVVDTAPATHSTIAQDLVQDEVKNHGDGRYYSDLATYQLLAARLALNTDATAKALRHWKDACRLLAAYGWHKDITVYELINPLPTLISLDHARGRVAVAQLQGLCERIPKHTDGKETRHTPRQWWRLLAAADPYAAAMLASLSLLTHCNDPNWILHGARSDLWRSWYHRTDPIVAGALRLTLEEQLDKNDPHALSLIAHQCDGSGRDGHSRLLLSLLGRIDERPFKYSVSNSDELLERDDKRVSVLNEVAAHVGMPRIVPFPASGPPSDRERTLFNQGEGAAPVTPLPDQTPLVFPSGASGLTQAIRAWRDRRYDETRPEWAPERFANVLGYRIIELAEGGRASEAETVLRLVADAVLFDDRSGLLRALAEGLERHGQYRLAVAAYVLTWTRSRGRGGWMTFGGESEVEALQHAVGLDRTLVLSTVADEVVRVVSQGLGSLGVTQALMFGFAKTGLAEMRSTPFDIWDEAFAVIADRAPRVAATDDPDETYVVPDSDDGNDHLGDLDAAFAAATLGGLAHPGREQKRRSLLAVKLLIDCRPTALANVVDSALSSLSDPATLTWLLRLIEVADEQAAPIVTASRNALIKLAQCPWLTVRVLARRLLPDDDVPPIPYCDPDRILLDEDCPDLLLPLGIDRYVGGATASRILDWPAGVRLSRAERLLPRLKEAVCARFYQSRDDEVIQERMHAQLRVLRTTSGDRWPDASSSGLE